MAKVIYFNIYLIAVLPHTQDYFTHTAASIMVGGNRGVHMSQVRKTFGEVSMVGGFPYAPRVVIIYAFKTGHIMCAH